MALAPYQDALGELNAAIRHASPGHVRTLRNAATLLRRAQRASRTSDNDLEHRALALARRLLDASARYGGPVSDVRRILDDTGDGDGTV